MKKVILIAISFCFTFNSLEAQKKYEKVMYNEVSSETSDMTITAKNAVSTLEFTKFNLKISNKTEDILLYKPEESKLKASGKDYIPKEKWLVIAPAETDNRVIDVKGTEFLIPSYSFDVNGVYKVSTTSKVTEAADFQLPPSQNDFKAGNFSCRMYDLTKETDRTVVKFECRYTGDKIGVIQPGKAAVRLPDGSEIANAKSKKAPVVLKKGDSEKITLAWDRMEGGKATDMQKIKMMIVWHSTFIESDVIKLDPVVIDFKIDETKSK